MKKITVSASKTYDIIISRDILDAAGATIKKIVGGQINTFKKCACAKHNADFLGAIQFLNPCAKRRRQIADVIGNAFCNDISKIIFLVNEGANFLC